MLAALSGCDELRDLDPAYVCYSTWLRYEPISWSPGCGAAWREGLSIKSMLQEPTNPLSRMPRFRRAVRRCSLWYSAARFGYIGDSVARGRAAEPVVGL